MIVLTHSDEHRLMQAIDPKSPFGYRNEAMIRLALHTGLRVSELAGLEVQHVCAAKPAGQTGRMVRHTLELPAELAKGHRARTIPLNTEARKAVTRILSFNHARGFSVAPEAPLFPNREHRAMSARAVQRMVAGYRKATQLDQAVTPHSLRHAFGTRLIDEDVPTHRVQMLMGHRRLTSTERYLHSSPGQLAKDTARLCHKAQATSSLR